MRKTDMIQGIQITSGTFIKYMVLIILPVVIYCSKPQYHDGQEDTETVNVKVTIVKPQKFLESGIYFGILEPAESANLVCYSGGRVEDINVMQGQYVKKGTSLAKIDSAKALSVLLSAKAQEDIALATLEQAKRHLAIGSASQLAVDQQNLAYLNAHDAYVDALKNYRGCLAITPVNGVVTRKFIELFHEIPPNTQTFSVAKLDSVKVIIGITENDIYNVTVGSDAILTLPMVPDRKWHGKVKNLAREADRQDRVFSAELYFENKGNILKPGISGRVQLVLAVFNHAMVLPSDIIVPEGIEHTVMVIDSENIVHRRFIKTGPQSETSTLVKGGLTFGDRVISEGFQLVREGTAVTVDNAVAENDTLSCK